MSNIKTGDILNFDYTGAVQSVTLPKGTYKLECWGAQGGYSSSNSGIEVGMGGKGGYSVGTITLNQKTPIYIYIYAGGVGSISGNGKADGGFPNGGSSWASNTSEGAGGGGGSSDIRIGTDSLHARVIVAGGGGGGGEDNETGGYGGGETGGAQVLEHLVVKLLQVDILESAVTLPMMVAAEAAAGTVLVQPAGKQPQLPVIVGTTHLALLAVLVMSTPLLQLKIILTDV